MKKIVFGTPESLTPSRFCEKFSYNETAIKYPVEKINFETNKRGCLIKMPLAADEQIYGLGLQLKGFSLRGRKQTMRSNADPIAFTGDSHAPVPFFVSTKGYGVYVDTARNVEFYFGSSEFLRKRKLIDSEQIAITNTEDLYANDKQEQSNISIQIPVAKGVELYIIEGVTITDIVAQYNKLSGGGCSVPKWGLFPIYRCYARYTQEEVLNVAKKLKNEDFPISIIGLEPGWQSHSYSCSLEWNKNNYNNPLELVNTLKSMNYHVNLWEHAFVHPISSIYEELFPYSGDYEVWQGCVPDFSVKEARKIFSEHHKSFVDIGIDGFKLDECDGSDLTNDWSFPNHTKFPGGLDGEQYHHLFGTLYAQTILDALGGTPTLSQIRNLGALAASYPFVLYSDLYDLKDFIRGCATAGFSGLLWSPEVRDTQSGTKDEFIRRLQVNVFSVQCLINAWYCENPPWEDLDCIDEARRWLKIRQRLVPRLCEAFDRYNKYGIPPMRALVSDYTDDSETYAIDDEYLLGNDLLVAPILPGQHKRMVYLPDGTWVDYFTERPVTGGWFEVETEDIPVYVNKDKSSQKF